MGLHQAFSRTLSEGSYPNKPYTTRKAPTEPTFNRSPNDRVNASKYLHYRDKRLKVMTDFMMEGLPATVEHYYEDYQGHFSSITLNDALKLDS